MLMTQKNIDEDININEISYVEFSIKDLEKYRYEFEKLKEEKIIAKECEFESNSWVIRTGIRTISVSFNMTEIEYQKILKGGVIHLGYEEFGIALRSYTLIELRRLTNVSIMLTINNIKAFLKTSDGFSSSFMKEVVTNEVFNKRAY